MIVIDVFHQSRLIHTCRGAPAVPRKDETIVVDEFTYRIVHVRWAVVELVALVEVEVLKA